MPINIIPAKQDLVNTGSLSTISKIFHLDLPNYKNPNFCYSYSGNELLLTSQSGNYALIDYKTFDLKHEAINESYIRDSTFLSGSFYSIAADKFIQINDLDGREIHILDDFNYFSNVGYLNYSRGHYLQTSLNSFGNLCYFDISIGKKAYTNKLKLKGYNRNTNFNDKVINVNGVTCVSNCQGLRKSSSYSGYNGDDDQSVNNDVNSYNKVKDKNYNLINFFSPKSRNPLAAINPFTKGSIKNITTTSFSNLYHNSLSYNDNISTYNIGDSKESEYSGGNKIDDVIAVLDNANTLHLFDVRNYFEPFFKVNLKHTFNQKIKHGNKNNNSNITNDYNVNYCLRNNSTCVKSINNIENVKMLGDTVLAYGFNNMFVMKLDLNNTSNNDSNTKNGSKILYTEAFKERITNTSFCPFESVVGVTTSSATDVSFESLVIPNLSKYWKSEVSTYDEFYPLYDKGNIKAKKDLEVKSLIHKLPANSIRLNIKEKEDRIDEDGSKYEGDKEKRNKEKRKIAKEYKQDKKELEEITKELKNVKVKRSKRKKMTLNLRKEIKKDDLRLKKQKVIERMKGNKDKFKKM